MKALSVALKDFQIFSKDIGSVFYLFIMPILFLMLFAGLGNVSDTSDDEALPLPVINLDPGGKASEDFVNILLEDKRVDMITYDENTAREQMSQAEIRYALFIPANFSADLDAGLKVSTTYVIHPNHDQITVDTVERVIQSATRDMMIMDYLYESLDQLREMQAAMPYADQYFNEQRVMDQVETQREIATERPLVSVEQTTPMGSEEEEAQIPNLGQSVAVGFAVLFVFLTSQNAAMSIFREKRQGSFRRLMAAPISKVTLMSGKLLPNLIMTLVQIVIIFMVGIFLLPLMGIPALDLSSDPLGLILTALTVALCSTSLGLLLASIARTQGQLGGISGGLLWVAGVLGGSIIPIFLFPDFLKNIAKFVPHYWANQAFYGLILRGETLAVIWPDLLVLLGFTAAFFTIGLWRFDFD